jgi:hypothetical protein
MTFPAWYVSFHAYSMFFHLMGEVLPKFGYHCPMDKPISSEPISVSVTVLQQLFLYLGSLKVDIDAFLGSLGIVPASVKSPDARIPVETYLLIQDQAAEYIHDPYLGLHIPDCLSIA